MQRDDIGTDTNMLSHRDTRQHVLNNVLGG